MKTAAAAGGPAAPEVAARDAVIGWFRGEFAAANAMIDALCGHLAQIGGGAEYEPVFAALHRRRLNWFPVLHMQKFYPVADVTAELRRIAEARAAGSCCYSEEAASTVIHEPVDDLPADPEPQPEPEPEQDPIQQDVAPVAEEPGAAAVNHAADHQVPDAEVDSSGDSSERKAASTTEDDNVDDDGRKYNHHLPLIHSSRALVSYCSPGILFPGIRICRTRSSLSLDRRRTDGDNHHDSISLFFKF
jgi:mRNA N6-methyladenine demethylase